MEVSSGAESDEPQSEAPAPVEESSAAVQETQSSPAVEEVADAEEAATTARPQQRPDPRQRFPPPAELAPPPRPRGLPMRSGEITFDDLKFDILPDQPYEPGMLTKDIEALDGQRVRIAGFMYPTSRQSGITRFVLVRDNMECCFGPGAALYDCIYVEMAPGESTTYSIPPVTVEGKFTIRERRGPDGVQTSIFYLVANSVE